MGFQDVAIHVAIQGPRILPPCSSDILWPQVPLMGSAHRWGKMEEMVGPSAVGFSGPTEVAQVSVVWIYSCSDTWTWGRVDVSPTPNPGKVVWQTNKGLPPMTRLNVIKMSFLLKNPCILSTCLANLIGFIMETDGLILQFVWTVSVWEWPVSFWKDTPWAFVDVSLPYLMGHKVRIIRASWY